jgi:hypothetical protein
VQIRALPRVRPPLVETVHGRRRAETGKKRPGFINCHAAANGPKSIWQEPPLFGRGTGCPDADGSVQALPSFGTIEVVMTTGRTRVALALGLWAMSAHLMAAPDRPLPDRDAFLKETRKHLQTDRSVQRNYVYLETRREQKLDSEGRVVEESVKVFESYPGLPGEPRWERLISKDGHPVSPEELAEQDRERSEKASEMAERLSEDPEKEKARQQREWQKLRRPRAQAVGDIYIVYDIQMLGRERIEGHDTIAFTLTPRPEAEPETREGELMKHFNVRAWISETEHELVRLEAEAIDTVSFGLGVLARVHKGARFSFLRRKINDEVWLPAVARYSGSARLGLLWTTRRVGVTEYSGYKKYSVETSSSFHSPN